jgi:type IV pilus assembly protein PilZ
MDETTDQFKETINKPGVLSLAIKEKSALYAAYMPYVRGGGLFIPTNKIFKIGEEVFMLLSLVDDPMKLKVVGKVIWITPVAQANRPQGIGVQFSEAILGGALKANRPTHTM